MLTYEKVLEIFADYLAEDDCAEVVHTRRCYAVMMWDNAGRDWEEVVPCETPRKLFEALLWEYDKYHSYRLAMEQGIEDYTPEIKAAVDAMCEVLRQKRREAER